MKTETMDLFKEAVDDIANGPRLTSYQELTEGLMRRMAEKGATLEQLTGRKFLNRKRSTLEAHCRTFGIAFPDYIPVSMRCKDWRKKDMSEWLKT